MPGNLHAIPQSVLDSWPKPNYVDPVRRSWFPAFSLAFMGVSTVLTWGRFYLRARGHAGEFGLDDIFVFIGWIFAIGLTAIACIDITWYGLDVHTWDVHPQDYVNAALMGWVAQVLFVISTCATKFSVLLFYRRMAKDVYSRKWLYAIWAALAVTVVYLVGMLLTLGFICQPLDAYWLSYDYEYKENYTCIDGDVFSPLSGSLSVFSDIYAVVLPCIMLRHYDLDVSRRQKIGLNIIFALGLVVAGCGAARTYYLWRINHTYDTSWTGFDLFVWSILECQLAIICASASTARVFFRRYLLDPFLPSYRSRSYNYSQRLDTESSFRDTSTVSDSPFPTKAKYDEYIEQRITTKSSRDGLNAVANHDEPSRADRPCKPHSIHFRSSESLSSVVGSEKHDAYAMRHLDVPKRPANGQNNRLSGFDFGNFSDRSFSSQSDAGNVA